MDDESDLRPPWPSAIEIAGAAACAAGAGTMAYGAVMLAGELTPANFRGGGFIPLLFIFGSLAVATWLNARGAWGLLTRRRRRWRASSRVRRQRCGRCGFDLRGRSDNGE